ncbi:MULTISPECIES: integrase family protein [unclassified Mesorhizobium]|uniref:tyrosine-type recombinase/integrase n=1 Tax=unclassified Mesorhizobium TaxID=325217 RepID=UPI0013E00011|nr:MULTISPECIES: integrase family protein [unclassified Mesorhizobium]
MPRIKLTERTIEKLLAPDPSGKQVLHWDADLKGFGVLCSGVTSTKTFIAQRTLPDGKTRRVTVAAVNEMALSKAREEAADMLVDLRKGKDPKARSMTLQGALDAYLKKYDAKLSANTVSNYKDKVENHLTSWLDKPLNFITRDAVEKRHGEIAQKIALSNRWKGEVTANTTMAILRLLWNFAADQDPTLPQNPVRLRKQWFAEERRERMVEADDMPVFYKAVCALPNPVAADYLRFILFTGLRRREAAMLKWAYVDFDKKLLHIPAINTKAKRKLDLPMSDFVRDLLVARRAVGKDPNDYVFPSHGKKTGYIAEPKFPLDAVAKACGVQVSVHDLRRTFITVAEETEISPMALKALVNHSLGNDVTEGYVQMRVERLRSPAQKVADRLKTLCGIVPIEDANVVAIG